VAWKYDEPKFAELLLYVADKLRDARPAGATKLNKVLFFAEFAHMRRYGQPISGAEYQKLERGPAPRRLVPVRQQLVETGQARIEEGYYLGYRQHRLIPASPVRPALLSPEEIDTVNEVIEDLRGLTARQVSDLSHEEEGWRMVDDGQTIPYEAAVLRRPVVTERVRAHGGALARQHGRA
jgi:uncharacterized phage-associated protein